LDHDVVILSKLNWNCNSLYFTLQEDQQVQFHSRLISLNTVSKPQMLRYC